MIGMIGILSSAFGVSGCEDEVRDLILKDIQSHCDTVETDSMGNLICLKKGTKGFDKKLMLTAHMDEVGFIISDITKDGYLRFMAVGGIDPRIVVGKRVVIGINKIPGVIGDKPPHFDTDSGGKATKIKDLLIDIGAKDEDDAKRHVSLGDYVCFDSAFAAFGDKLIKGKALDDRVGCAILMALAQKRYPHDVYFVFTTQEEVGCRGAATAAYSIMPDAAIVVESTTCSDVPGSDDAGFSTKLRSGAALSVLDRGSYSDKGLRSLLSEIAKRHGIQHQYKQTTMGGNDASVIHLTQTGVRTAVVSVPCRYIHSPSSVASLDDIEACRCLLEKFLEEEAEEKWHF